VTGSTHDKIIKTDPDPTEAVKEALTLAIENLRREVNQRFDSNDKAVALAREEVKTSAAELAKANSEALKFALTTATDSSSKLGESFKIDSKATNEKIDRLTERINIWTGRDSNVIETKSDRVAEVKQSWIMVSIAIAAIALMYSIFGPHR
jgi:predicted nucleotide-binding protein (sugar kinase/HSP70/actin superfamily)